jgi:hypothetical protein
MGSLAAKIWWPALGPPSVAHSAASLANGPMPSACAGCTYIGAPFAPCISPFITRESITSAQDIDDIQCKIIGKSAQNPALSM